MVICSIKWELTFKFLDSCRADVWNSHGILYFLHECSLMLRFNASSLQYQPYCQRDSYKIHYCCRPWSNRRLSDLPSFSLHSHFVFLTHKSPNFCISNDPHFHNWNFNFLIKKKEFKTEKNSSNVVRWNFKNVLTLPTDPRCTLKHKTASS